MSSSMGAIAKILDSTAMLRVDMRFPYRGSILNAAITLI